MYDCVQLEAGASVTASNLVWRGDGVANAWDSVSSNWFDGVTTVPFLNGDDVVFDDSGSNAPPINLSGFLSPGSVTVNASQDYTFGGSGSLGGPMALFKSGSGQLILTTSNSFSGGTTISNGTLLVNNTRGSGTGTGAVTVASGGTLGGTGVIGGPVTVNGTLAPGSSSVGTLTVSNNLVVNSGAVLAYELGTTSDRTVVSGNLTLGGTLNVSDAGGFGVGTYTLFTYGGTLAYNGLTIGSAPSGYNYGIDTGTAGQVKLVVSAWTAFQQWQMNYFDSHQQPRRLRRCGSGRRRDEQHQRVPGGNESDQQPVGAADHLDCATEQRRGDHLGDGGRPDQRRASDGGRRERRLHHQLH